MLRRRCLGPIYVHTLAHHALSEQPPRHAQLYSFDKQHCQTGPFGWSADDSQLVVILVLVLYLEREGNPERDDNENPCSPCGQYDNH